MAEESLTPYEQQTNLTEQYQKELDTNPKYSLEVDPENKYNMTDEMKSFIKFYVDYKSVPTAAELAGIEVDTAKQWFVSFNVQNEIRRINLALYHRQFASRLLTLDEIGGFLSCLITNEGVPIADQLKTKDKLQVVDLLLQLNKMKVDAYQDPRTLMEKDLELELKKLSVKTISQLINANKPKDIIQTIDADQVLSPEEKAYLSTLPAKDLLQLIDDTNAEPKGEPK